MKLRIAVLGLCCALSPVFAATLGLDFTGGNGNFVCGTSQVPGCIAGWAFHVNSGVTVTALGVWDSSPNGLFESHPAGLWTSGGSLLTSTTVTNASTAVSSTSTGRWLFQSISGTALAPGDYVVGAYYSPNNAGDNQAGNATASTVAQITFTANRLGLAAALAFPTQSAAGFDAGFFGANLQIADVPEPAPATLLMMAFGVLALYRRVLR